MADDKTTKTPEQPVTDSGPGKETPPAPPKEPEKVSVSPEPEKKTEPEVKNPQVSVYNFAEVSVRELRASGLRPCPYLLSGDGPGASAVPALWVFPPLSSEPPAAFPVFPFLPGQAFPRRELPPVPRLSFPS